MKENITPYNIPKPSEIIHNNDDYALIDDSEIRGGLKIVNNITERNEIPLDKRGYGVVKYINTITGNTGEWVVKSYTGSDLTNINWLNENNWSEIGGGIENTIYKTVFELLTLISLSGLTIGQQYIISDFKTVYVQPVSNETLSGSTEPLLVTANSTSALEPIVFSLTYPQDIIYYNINDTTNGSLCGRITRRIDSIKNINVGLDWRTILYRRWCLNVTNEWVQGDDYTIGDIVTTGSDIHYCTYTHTNSGDLNTHFNQYPFYNGDFVSISPDGQPIKIGNSTYAVPILTTGTTYQDNPIFKDLTGVYNIKIENQNEIQELSNNVFLGVCYNALIKGYSINNTIGSYFHDNIASDQFHNNVIGESFINNNLSNNFTDNTILYQFVGNAISDYFIGNSLDSDFVCNKIETNFINNVIGNDFQNNIVGAYFIENNIDRNCVNNKIGVGVNNNIIDINFHDNDIGNWSTDNILGQNFNGNTIEIGFVSNNIGTDFNNNDIGKQFNNNTIGNSFQINIIDSHFLGNTIGDNFEGNTIGMSFIGNTIENYFNTNTIGKNFITNIIQDYFNHNKISLSFERNNVGYGFQNNHINNYCNTNTFGVSCYFNILGDNFINNHIGNSFQYNNIEQGFSGNIIGRIITVNYSNLTGGTFVVGNIITNTGYTFNAKILEDNGVDKMIITYYSGEASQYDIINQGVVSANIDLITITFGDTGFNNNNIGNDFSANDIGNGGCQNWYVGNGNNNWKIGQDNGTYAQIVVGCSNSNITIGSGNDGWVIGSENQNIIIGDDNGNDTSENRIGNQNSYITIGNSNLFNSIGSKNRNLVFGDEKVKWSIGHDMGFDSLVLPTISNDYSKLVEQRGLKIVVQYSDNFNDINIIEI